MKSLLLIVVAVLAFSTVQPQHLQIKKFYRNIRAGFQAGLSFSIDKKFDSIDLRVSQGKVERQGDLILLWPEADGKDTLITTIYHKHRLILIDTTKFDIIKPEIFPFFGGDLIIDRKLTVAKLKALGGIIFNIRITDDHWEGSGVESYRFSVIRKDSCIYSKIENSYLFSDELKLKIETLLPGDIILISEARINPTYDKIANIVPGVFEIY